MIQHPAELIRSIEALGVDLFREDRTIRAWPSLNWPTQAAIVEYDGVRMGLDPRTGICSATSGRDVDLTQWRQELREEQYAPPNSQVPSYVVFDPETRSLLFIGYWKAGLPHRDADRPARVYFLLGEVYQWEWWQNGVLHRDNDLPALIETDGKRIVRLEWWSQGRLHRSSGRPAQILNHSPSGNLESESWYQNGLLHSFGDKPAAKRYSKKGNLLEQGWYRYGRPHRDNGPAREKRLFASLLTRFEWWRHGECMGLKELLGFPGMRVFRSGGEGNNRREVR
jgi:hypothetical protein